MRIMRRDAGLKPEERLPARRRLEVPVYASSGSGRLSKHNVLPILKTPEPAIISSYCTVILCRYQIHS